MEATANDYSRDEISARLTADGDRVVVELTGEFDLAGVGFVSTAIVDAISAGGRDVVVDLAGVSFMDASTLRAVLHGRSLVATRGGRLTVRAARPGARRLFEACDLTELIESGDAVATAGSPVTALGTWVRVPNSDRPISHLSGDGRDPRRANSER